jgi:hypothetical protein
MSGGQIATLEVQRDGSVSVEVAEHRDDDAALVLSTDQRSGMTAEAAAGMLAAEAAAGRLAAAAESARLGSLRKRGEQGTGTVPQNWSASVRSGAATRRGERAAASAFGSGESGIGTCNPARLSAEP